MDYKRICLVLLLLNIAVFARGADPILNIPPVHWQAKWIEIGYAETANRPVQVFLKSFDAAKPIKSAKLFITSHGLYEAFVNGKRLGDAYLTPGWTSYHKRLQYQVYDLRGMILKGNNDIEVNLASGWYRGLIGIGPDDNAPDRYGKTLALLFQLEITYADGSKAVVISDESWQSAESRIRYSEIYNGEIADARFMAKTRYPVKVANHEMDNLVPTISEPVRKQERFKPVKIFKAPNGDTLADFGQNLVGFVQLKVAGRAGDSIRIEHAEVLDKAGNFYTASLRSAKAMDTYILKGGGIETLEPHFTWHGFRYARLKGFREMVKPEQLEAVALYSDMKSTGSFSCSNPLLNQLQHNMRWSQNGNFLDIPTDCPQRDERMGWMGDAMVFCRTAAFNRNVNLFFKKWLKDVAADQLPDGAPTAIVPNLLGRFGGASGWADAATVIPWTMYQVYGDKELLADQYPSMKAWVSYMEKNSPNGLFQKGFQFGDWLSYRTEGLVDSSARTDVHLVSQCFYALSTQILSDAAGVLGKADDQAHYSALLAKVKDAFNKEYVTPSGRLTSNTQTAYTLALAFDLLPEALRPVVAGYLVANIRSYRNHLTTGFLGTPYICHVLSRFGYTDVAYQLLLQESYPSWLYPVKMGATTIWERWDGIKPDGSFQTPKMNSFNHYAYGAIGDWMYQHILGIQIGSPGFKHIVIKPAVGGGLTWAKGSYECGYGLITVDWKIGPLSPQGGSIPEGERRFILDVNIPAGTTAEIFVPRKGFKEYDKKRVQAGHYSYRVQL